MLLGLRCCSSLACQFIKKGRALGVLLFALGLRACGNSSGSSTTVTTPSVTPSTPSSVPQPTPPSVPSPGLDAIQHVVFVIKDLT